MTADLQSGQVLNERFRLDQPMRSGAHSALWSAHDLQLDAPVLLEIHALTNLAGEGVADAIRRAARHNRRLHHPRVARVHDVHESEGLLLVSIDHHDGELLSEQIENGQPMPYRRMVGAIRPLVEALAHMHESGSEHGRIDAEHVLVDESGWTLLPGDASRAARSDMHRLGDLAIALLTGGQDGSDDRPLNDVADRLHEGRTIPALLEQLIGDLRSSAPAARPTGMRDVLHRLDQLEAYVEPGGESPAADVAPITIPVAAAPTAPARSGTPRALIVTAAIIGLLVVPGVLVGGAFLLGRLAPSPVATTNAPAPVEVVDAGPPAPVVTAPATGDAPDTNPDTPTSEPPPGAPVEPPTEAPTETPTGPDAATSAAERQAAEASLDRAMSARTEADTIGAASWAPESYDIAAGAATAGDQAFLDEDFVAAAGHYDTAATAFSEVVEQQDTALARLLVEGQAALAAPDSAAATLAFRNALLIDPENDPAQLGLSRAETLDELHRLLESGLAHETEGRLEFAYVDFTEAAQLDPHSQAATNAMTRVRALIADQEFASIMSRGLDAYHRGDLPAARDALREAKQFRPDAPGIDEAMAMVAEAEVRQEVDRMRELAASHARSEQWQAAWNAYRQLLAIDENIEFAQEGMARSERMMKLEKHVQHYLDNPALLTKDGTREDAQKLATTMSEMSDLGPRLRQAHAELLTQVRLANTPRRVVLRSDNKTAVDIYRVGRYGTFDRIELELLPGKYTVVGHRAGYKDVRVTLELLPGQAAETLEVICTESI